MTLKACEETLHELKRMAEKRDVVRQSEGIKNQLRVVKERVLWPYRKEDLEEVRATLGRFQDNLALALQSASLDGTLRRLEDLHSKLEVQHQQATRLKQVLNDNTEVVEMIRQDVAGQSPALARIFDEIIGLRTQLLEYSVVA